MKTFMICLLSCLCTGILFSQNLHLSKGESSKSALAYSYLQLDINYLNYPIKNVTTNGISVIGAAVFGDRIATGLSIDVTDSKKMSFAQINIPNPNLFEYTQMSFYNEVFFHPNSRIDISLPVKLGLGHATISENGDFVFGRTLFSNQDVTADDYFFVSELGVNVSVHLIRTLDFNIGGSYRLTSGANGIVQNDDFFNYSIHAGLRFRIAGRH